MELYLIRHAESEMNARKHIISGRSNETPLTDVGRRQAELLGRRFKQSNSRFDDIYTSTAVRTRDTARIAMKYAEFSLDRLLETPEILELDQGDWVGCIRKDTYTSEVLAEMQRDPWNFSAPNGESQKDVELRMMDWIERIAVQYSAQSTIAVFTHGVAIKCLLRGILDFPPHLTYHINIDNTSITRIQYDTKWNLLAINDTMHFL